MEHWPLNFSRFSLGGDSKAGWEADHDWFVKHLGEGIWGQQNPEAIWTPRIVTFSGCARSFNELIDGFLRPVFGEGYHHFGAPEKGGKSDAWFFSRPIHIFLPMPKAGARGRKKIETYFRCYLNRLEVLIHKNRKTQARWIRPRQLLFASFESEKAARGYFKPIVTDLPLEEAWKHIELPKFRPH
jgi:hypothetical protein